MKSIFFFPRASGMRALKALERQGLIVVCRGKATQAAAKPCGNYLESGAFHSRSTALDELALAFRDCLDQPDGLRFTALFDRLSGISLRKMKQGLLRMGDRSSR